MTHTPVSSPFPHQARIMSITSLQEASSRMYISHQPFIPVFFMAKTKA